MMDLLILTLSMQNAARIHDEYAGMKLKTSVPSF